MPSEEISYEEFGRGFFEVAVTEERIRDGFAGLAGEPIAFGPIGAGPGKLSQISASGTVGTASVQHRQTAEVSFTVTVPIDLELAIDLRLDVERFHAKVTLELTLHAKPLAPLRIFIDVEPPRTEDVTVELHGDNLRSKIFQRVANVDDELARFVARYVTREIEKPNVRAARDVDIARRIEGQ